jgi:hypothetical protein
VRKLPKLPNLSPLAIKHLWIRTALFEKVLDKVVHYLVENSRCALPPPLAAVGIAASCTSCFLVMLAL